MARSIHDTRGVLHRAASADWSDHEFPRAIAEEMRANIRRQAAIRESERRLRREGPARPQPIDVEQVPILVDDEGPHVFHPLSEEDIRAILRRIPPGSVDGLRGVRLRVDRRKGKPSWPRDPFTGRRRYELVPGVYTSPTLGIYHPRTATIWIHAYLGEPEAVAPFALYFKLIALKVLAHEVGHHFDLTFRVGRSRWVVDDREKEEAWADATTTRWRDILAAYVEERYPAQCDELEKWVEERAGVKLWPLLFLAEARTSSLEQAFHELVRSVQAGRDGRETRIRFARQLHRLRLDEEATTIVGAMLASGPDDPRALAVDACIALCGERAFERSESTCRRAIELDPHCADAWETLVRCYATQRRWEEAATSCEQGLAVIAQGDIEHGEYLLNTLVESDLLLGAATRVESDLARMRAWGDELIARRADVYGVIDLCWREQWQDAHVLASRFLSMAKYDAWRLWLGAAQLESAHRLGRPPSAGALDVSALETNPFTREWSRRLIELQRR